jgi:hypothetical protein
MHSIQSKFDWTELTWRVMIKPNIHDIRKHLKKVAGNLKKYSFIVKNDDVVFTFRCFSLQFFLLRVGFVFYHVRRRSCDRDVQENLQLEDLFSRRHLPVRLVLHLPVVLFGLQGRLQVI